jgi:dTDP-4-amino-4,6-dideoxygalactose transaminase
MTGPGMQVIGEEEIQEVVELLRGGYIYRYGSERDPNFKAKVYQLEQEIARFCRAPYGVAVSSGTSALLVALSALGVGPGDEVIVPGYTYIASISSIIYARAIPVLAEIDRTFNIDPTDVEAKITTRTKAIMVVHMAGNPARMSELKAIADRHGIVILEDSAQVFGATYREQPVGSIGTIGAFSFNANKTITSGDGGMVITRDVELYRVPLLSMTRDTRRYVLVSKSDSGPSLAWTFAGPSCRRPSSSHSFASCPASSATCAPTSGTTRRSLPTCRGCSSARSRIPKAKSIRS